MNGLRERLAERGYTLDVDAFRELDSRRRHCVTETEQLKAERNRATAEIGKLRKTGEDTAERQQQVRAMGERITELDEPLRSWISNFGIFSLAFPICRTRAFPSGAVSETT